MTETEKKEFLNEVANFWRYKGNMERYTSFDNEKLREADTILQAHWVNYKVAISMLDSRVAEILDK